MLNEYELKISAQNLQVLVACMHKAPMPYEQTAPLLNLLQAQVTEQEKAAAEPVSSEAETEDSKT